jgi:ribonuclease E
MANKMLIDAAHPEETRVVVLRGNRVEEFDFESASRKQLRGNIYLAKVTRVEPSLQAAFVDYGGNRHGFLAFSEIHPDYYQIPVADRQALIEEEEREAEEAERHADEAEDKAEAIESAHDSEAAPADVAIAAGTEGDTFVSEPASDEPEHPAERVVDGDAPAAAGAASPADVTSEAAPAGSAETADEASGDNGEAGEPGGRERSADAVEVVSDDRVESIGAEDVFEEVPERRRQRPRQYKIQEVIKRRQVLLVQVVKEERGNKGAALTTYLSLAGRYSVLMPNTARGGGISRKITSPADRKRLKEVATDLEVPEGMGVILRTAGASRTKAEVKRDFEYLLRLWENVRELTLRSTAPTLVYEEGSLIKRSIRDLYNKDIDEIDVAGDDAYREAKDFMRMLMPSHAKNVQPYKEKQPLFARAGIEAQLDAMFSPQVTLRSGGYLVINQTEALVSIDVNSGRSTREHNIEDTALQTNLEAADEVARQLRLRDLAGLIVIDFIDMEEKRNNRSVERRLKEALKNDRARIQVGRISHFGLLEMSRQRIRTGVLESTTTTCPVCQGSGHVRAPSSVALHVLRSLEDQLLRGVTHNLTVKTRTPVALYILNQKRAHISELEQRFGLTITVLADELIQNGQHFTVERGEPIERREPVTTTVQPDSVQPIEEIAEEEDEIVEETDETEVSEAEDRREDHGEGRGDGEGGRRRRRRRRGRRGNGERPSNGHDEHEPVAAAGHGEDFAAAEEDDEGEEGEGDAPAHAGHEDDNGLGPDGQPRKRRRGRRGGRRGRRGRGGEERRQNGEAADGQGDAFALGESVADPSYAPSDEGSAPAERNEAVPGDHAPPADGEREADAEPAPRVDQVEPHHAEVATPQFNRRDPEEASEPVAKVERVPQPEEEPEDPNRPKRSGWWQRRSFFGRSSE